VKEEMYPVASLQGNNEVGKDDIAQEIRVDCSFMKICLLDIFVEQLAEMN